MEEEYTRRKQQRPTSTSKTSLAAVILLLLINTLGLCLLLFLNVQAESKQDEKLSSIEQQVKQLDQRTTVQPESYADTEKNVPVKESSTAASTTTESSSSSTTMESVNQTEETIPSSEVAQHQTAEPTATTYTVQAGDTLSVIAEKNKLSLQDLMTKNNLTDSTVYVGQVLSLQ